MRFEVHYGPLGQFRWRLIDWGGRCLAKSGEEFGDVEACLRAIDVVRGTDFSTRVDDTKLGYGRSHAELCAAGA